MSAMERLVQGKRHIGKKAQLARHFIAVKVALNVQYFYLFES